MEADITDPFNSAVTLILRHEGGFVDHPDDPGGATNMGITHRTLAAWRRALVTVADVRGMNETEARDIYRDEYWHPVRGDQLPPGVGLSVFDMAVNAGVSRAARLLQRCVGVAQDGIIGPITLQAARTCNTVDLIHDYHAARMGFYRSLRTWKTFGRGWTRRAEETRAEALRLAQAAHVAPPQDGRGQKAIGPKSATATAKEKGAPLSITAVLGFANQGLVVLADLPEPIQIGLSVGIFGLMAAVVWQMMQED